MKDDWLTGFGVDEGEGAIDGDGVAVSGPIPEVAVAGDKAAAAFPFDEKDAGLGDDEGVDFVDGAIVGDEFEVGVDEDGVAIGQRVAEEFEGLTFVGVAGFGELFPATGGEGHMKDDETGGWA